MMRSIFATLMAVLVAGSYAQTNSSSSSTGARFSSSSIIANISVSSSPAVVPNVTISSSSLPIFNGSSTIPSFSSSSTGMGPIPGFNGSSSSSSVWVMSSSSSTGSDSPALYPAGTQEITYQVELASGTLAPGLAEALARDFAATIAREPTLNVTAQALYDYIRVTIRNPDTNQTSNPNGRALLAVGPANTTAYAIILGNVTNVVVIGNARDLAVAFYNAATTGNVVVTSSQAFGVRVYPQQVVVIESPLAVSSTGSYDDGTNGASSIASASLLIGSMIAALALAF